MIGTPVAASQIMNTFKLLLSAHRGVVLLGWTLVLVALAACNNGGGGGPGY